MNLSKLIIAAALLSCPWSTIAQETLTPKDTITDNNIVPPSSLALDTYSLQETWYLQRYTSLDKKGKPYKGTPATDDVYIQRLQALPNIIEMPFNSVVKQYIEIYAVKKAPLVEKMLGMSLYYMPIFEEAIEKQQIPNELKYLPIIESALNPNAVSKSGASGLWQFMTPTAINEGLEINSLVDERRDPIASSEAAAHYLLTLYNMYQDWTLAVAAYNCGPGTLNKAIKRAGDVKDYWAIYPFLPAETRGYIPAFIAANYIMNYYYEHGISPTLARKPMITDTVHVNKKVHFQQISEVMGIPIEEIRILNPQYRQDIIPGNIRPYTLVLPSVQAYCYVANEDSIVSHNRDKYFGREEVEPSDGRVKADNNGSYVEELVVKKHKVKRGETLKSIARTYGVTVESIREANNLKSGKVKTGTVLNINTYVKKYAQPEEPNAMPAGNDYNSEPSDSTGIVTPEAMPDSIAAVSADSKPSAKEQPAPQKQKKETKKKQETKQPQKQKSDSKAAATTNYTVKKGDTLYRIANIHGITVEDIKRANSLKSDRLDVGQKLKIPKKK